MVVMSMHALVINLERSKERLDFQQKQLAVLGISFVRIPAVSANDLSDTTYTEHANNWERPLRRTEVACSLSHIKAWEAVVQRNAPFLILEDDALLSTHTKEVLDALVQQTDYDCVNLETRARKKRVSKKKSHLWGNFYLSKLIQDKSGAAAYVLWPNGAKLLLEWVHKCGLGLADATIALGPSWNHGQVEPAAAIQLDCCNHYKLTCPLETSTGIHNNPKPESSTWYPFLWRRLRGQVRIAVKKLIHFLLSESVELKPCGFREST